MVCRTARTRCCHRSRVAAVVVVALTQRQSAARRQPHVGQAEKDRIRIRRLESGFDLALARAVTAAGEAIREARGAAVASGRPRLDAVGGANAGEHGIAEGGVIRRIIAAGRLPCAGIGATCRVVRTDEIFASAARRRIAAERRTDVGRAAIDGAAAGSTACIGGAAASRGASGVATGTTGARAAAAACATAATAAIRARVRVAGVVIEVDADRDAAILVIVVKRHLDFHRRGRHHHDDWIADPGCDRRGGEHGTASGERVHGDGVIAFRKTFERQHRALPGGHVHVAFDVLRAADEHLDARRVRRGVGDGE